MTALSLDSAKNIAIVVALVFLVLTVASAWLIKNIVTKLIMIVLMGGLALGAWTQRTSLQDCASKARDGFDSGSTTPVTCTFFGTDVNVPTP